jgi:hypothetical protein
MRAWAKPVFPHRVRRMFTAVFVGRGLIAVRQVMIIPLMLHAWGADYYGAWLILSSIPTFMAMSNLGVGTSARCRTLEVAAGHISAARSTIKLGTMIVAAVGVLAVIVGYLGVNFFSQLQSPLHIVKHASGVMAVLLATTFVQMLADWWTHNSFQPSDSAWNGGVLQLGVNRPWRVNVYGIGSAALSVGRMRIFGSGGSVFFSAFALLFDSMMAAFVLPHSWRMLAKATDDAG